MMRMIVSISGCLPSFSGNVSVRLNLLVGWNKARLHKVLFERKHRIGIHYDKYAAGNMGGEQRLETKVYRRPTVF